MACADQSKAVILTNGLDHEVNRLMPLFGSLDIVSSLAWKAQDCFIDCVNYNIVRCAFQQRIGFTITADFSSKQWALY